MKAKTSFLLYIGYLNLTKDCIKLDLLQILVLVLPLISVLLLSNLMSYDTVRRCMKLQVKIGFGQ